jgi:hypothetical protein
LDPSSSARLLDAFSLASLLGNSVSKSQAFLVERSFSYSYLLSATKRGLIFSEVLGGMRFRK